mmetsp:Transcript_22312/g.39519  ORF Transcript_22312/g.39519 Transcript_22312/m.39519 type:complete len:253 (-) Transcript_22312:228-986(-)
MYFEPLLKAPAWLRFLAAVALIALFSSVGLDSRLLMGWGMACLGVALIFVGHLESVREAKELKDHSAQMSPKTGCVPLFLALTFVFFTSYFSIMSGSGSKGLDDGSGSMRQWSELAKRVRSLEAHVVSSRTQPPQQPKIQNQKKQDPNMNSAANFDQSTHTDQSTHELASSAAQQDRSRCEQHDNKDLSGSDIANDAVKAKDFSACCDICSNHPLCVAFSLVERDGLCWLKSANGGLKHKAGVVTGVLPPVG